MGGGMRLPSCPRGDFCGPAPLARAQRSGTEEKLGCPSGLDPKTWEGAPGEPSTPPVQGHSHVSLNEGATAAKRAKRDATTCCYEWSTPCPGGRPLVAEGVVRVASLARTGSWIVEPIPEVDLTT